MRITRKQWIVGVGSATLVFLIVWAMRPKPLPVDVAAVALRPLESTVEADGRTRVRDRFNVVAPVSGRVERLTLREGALIRAGQIVATIAVMPLDAQAVQQLTARLSGARAIALEAAAQARAAQATAAQLERDVSRTRQLAAAGAVAPSALEAAELSLAQASEAARSAAHRQQAAESDVEQARAALLGTSGPSPRVVVRAPSAGRVLRVPDRSERIVQAGAPLLELGDVNALEVVVDVLSSDALLIHPGDRVRLGQWTESTESDRPLGGHVREIEPSAFTKVSALGVEEQRVNVIVDFDEAPAAMGDGFRVDANIVVWQSESATAVPVSALLRSADGWAAFILRGGRATRRSVRVGHLAGQFAETLSGLEAGDVVIVFPSDRVTDGARVKPRS